MTVGRRATTAIQQVLRERVRRLVLTGAARRLQSIVATSVPTASVSVWSEPGAFVQFPDFLPTDTFTVADVPVGYNQLITMLIALVSAIGLYLFFRWSRLGVSMRAVVDNPDLVNIAGTNQVHPDRTTRCGGVRTPHHVFAGVHRDHTGQRSRRRHVDRHQTPMRDRAALERGVEHPR